MYKPSPDRWEGGQMAKDFCGQTMTLSVQTGKFQGLEIPQLRTGRGSSLASSPSRQRVRTASFRGMRLCYTLERPQQNESTVQRSWGAPGFARNENLQLDLMAQGQLYTLH